MKDSVAAYQPIDCTLYDHFEIAAIRKTPVIIDYTDEMNLLTISTIIKTLVTENKVEYLMTMDNLSIRLDKILSLKSTDGQIIINISDDKQTCNIRK
jgi:transcriptional antiterminator Rof (Rho-off)